MNRDSEFKLIKIVSDGEATISITCSKDDDGRNKLSPAKCGSGTGV
jgi:hypothetical protein